MTRRQGKKVAGENRLDGSILGSGNDIEGRSIVEVAEDVEAKRAGAGAVDTTTATMMTETNGKDNDKDKDK